MNPVRLDWNEVRHVDPHLDDVPELTRRLAIILLMKRLRADSGVLDIPSVLHSVHFSLCTSQSRVSRKREDESYHYRVNTVTINKMRSMCKKFNPRNRESSSEELTPPNTRRANPDPIPIHQSRILALCISSLGRPCSLSVRTLLPTPAAMLAPRALDRGIRAMRASALVHILEPDLCLSLY